SPVAHCSLWHPSVFPPPLGGRRAPGRGGGLPPPLHPPQTVLRLGSSSAPPRSAQTPTPHSAPAPPPTSRPTPPGRGAPAASPAAPAPALVAPPPCLRDNRAAERPPCGSCPPGRTGQRESDTCRAGRSALRP